MYVGIFLFFIQEKLIQETNAVSTFMHVQEDSSDPQLMKPPSLAAMEI